MYLEKKKIGNEIYNYLKISVRYKNTVRTKTVAYLGKGDVTKKELKKLISKYKLKSKNIEMKALEELKTDAGENISYFLGKEQLAKLEQIKEDFIKKIKSLDDKTKQDMFNDFLTLYVYNTNAIEGNTLTLRETDLLLNKGITPQGKSLREINDHLNAKETLQFILNDNLAINHKNIIKIHSMLMKNIDNRVGDYRKHNVRVFGAKFESSPAEYVKIDMEILLKWHRKNKTRLHPLILCAVLHHKFEKIHPFYDGNGRTGRMLLNIILLRDNIPPLIVPDAQRKRYYNSLALADNTDLDKLYPEHKEIIKFCYFSLLKTYNTVFKRWG